MNWRWIITVALLAALLAGYGAFLRRDVSSSTSSNTLEQPGYYLNDAVVTQSKEDGSPGITLVAKRIEQQQRQEQITLIDVNVDYRQAAQQSWVLTAKRAVVPPDSRIVQFTGDVELRPRQSTQKTYLRTQALTVDTEKNLAYSNDSPVDVRLGPYTLTAQRIEVDLRNEKVRLRAVDGRSTPEPPSTGRRRE
jgi:LPS export ABC transporter protein LptC